MKTLLATVAASALLGTAGLAQDAADDTAIYSVAEGDYYASNLLGSRLYTIEGELGDDVEYATVSADWNDVGEINDFVVGEDGSVQAVIVGVGGFLGVGEKDVAISWDDVSPTYDDDGSRFLVASMTQEALENAPAFEYEELDNDVGEAAAMDGQDAGVDAAAEDAAADVATDTAATDEAAETEMAEGEAAADVTEASEEATDMAQAEATDGDAVSTETELADGEVADNVEAAEGAEATETAEATEPAAAEGAEATETAEATDPAAAEGAEATETAEATDPAAADGAEATDMAATDAAVPEGFELVQVDMLTAEELDGATVRSASNEEWVGDIGELILDDQGKITQAVIDVGGFLGIGQKPVAMNFEDLEIFRQGDGGALEIRVNSTREELEGMEAYAD